MFVHSVCDLSKMQRINQSPKRILWITMILLQLWNLVSSKHQKVFFSCFFHFCVALMRQSDASSSHLQFFVFEFNILLFSFSSCAFPMPLSILSLCQPISGECNTLNINNHQFKAKNTVSGSPIMPIPMCFVLRSYFVSVWLWSLF